MTRWVLLVAVGCASSTPEAFDDPPLVLEQVGNGALHVRGRAYTMEFAAPGTGMLLPERLVIDGKDVLASNSCNTEAKIGVAVYPALNAIAGPDLGANRQNVTSTITPTPGLTGPAVVQLVVEYGADYTCAGTQRLQGTSTFTFYATGRIVRRDVFSAATSGTLVANGAVPCGCSDTAFPGFFVTSFWAFEATGAANVDVAGQNAFDGLQQACTIYSDKRAAIGVAWSGSSTRIGVNGTAAHVFDFVTADSPTISNEPREVFSAIQIADESVANSGCAKLIDRLAVTQLALVDGGVTTTLDTDASGMFVDTGDRRGGFEIRAAPGSVLPIGFALRVRLGNATHASVTRTPEAADEPSVAQRIDDDEVVFVFNQGLGLGESIVVEPF